MQQTRQSLTLHCVNHRESYIQFISLAKENNKGRLLCAECLLPGEQGNVEKKFIDLIPLAIAINSPELLLNWMIKDSGSEYLNKLNQYSEKDLEKEFNEQVNKFDQMIKLIEKFKQQIRSEMQEYKNQQVQLKKYREQLYEKIKYNKFCQLLFQLQELDNQFQSDQYTSVEKELVKTVDEMLKDKCALISKEIDQIQQEHNRIVINLQKHSFEELQKQINQIFQSYDQYIKKLNEDVKSPQQIRFQYAPFKILSNEYFKIIEKKIENDSKQKIKSMDLVYLGSRDGLDGTSFWSKVNGKKNLLMIFQSNNQGSYVFGGYSPCQWQSNLNGYVQDDTLSSFLFSQTYYKIYPLRQDKKQHAIYCGQSQGYGPRFGIGTDLQLQIDFSKGGSNLGNTYYWENYKQDAYNDYLFGNIQPNIGECEIYEVKFNIDH